MTTAAPHITPTELRAPRDVMRLRRMGASFPTRLSFLRTLLRRLRDERAEVTRPVWEMCQNGFGHAVYTVHLGGHPYSLVAISTDLPPDQRTDRVIATAWDSTYVLYDGVPDDAEIDRIVSTAPHQEASRYMPRDLVLSRANKSVRLFAHVTDALAGKHPLDEDLIRQTGYLMRTTAVYGNGKFGIADRARIAERPGLEGPFMAEMLTVWLIRGFTHDLAEHVGGAALPAHIKRFLGIGNSTGLGMAPFLVSHPVLLDAWLQARETAVARVSAIDTLTSQERQTLLVLAETAAQHLDAWEVPDPIAAARISDLRKDWAELRAALPKLLTEHRPIAALLGFGQRFFEDTQELLTALALEPFGDLIDGLTDCMASPFVAELDPAMQVATLKSLLTRDWQWALDLDFDDNHETAQFWYVSEAKQEPRLGLRHEEAGAELESPLDIARRVQALHLALADIPETLRVAEFAMTAPQHRFALRRVQNLADRPYAEIRDNLISQECLPIDMLRFKLAFFGATGFDPKSDRWTRITLFSGAPLRDDIETAPECWLPVFEHAPS